MKSESLKTPQRNEIEEGGSKDANPLYFSIQDLKSKIDTCSSAKSTPPTTKSINELYALTKEEIAIIEKAKLKNQYTSTDLKEEGYF